MLALPYWFAVCTVVSAAACGFAYARRLRRRGIALNDRLRTRDLPLIPLTLIVFIAVLAGASLASGQPEWMWRMPLALDYYYRPLFWALKLAFVTFPLSAITFLAFSNGNRGRLLVLAFTVAAITAIEVQMQVVHRPYLGEVEDTRTPDGIITRSNPATCAAATCANIARHFGFDVTEAGMIRRLNTSWEGTSPAQMVYGLRAMGLEARKVSSPGRNLGDVTPPAVILLDVGTEPDAHAVAYMARDGDRFEIWNPQSGRVLMTSDEVRKQWRGHAIEVHRGH